MMDEEIQKQINQFRLTAQAMGDAALEAISLGDAGLARTAARQAAQYARVALQLETGERQFEQQEDAAAAAASAAGYTGGSISV